MFRRASAGAWLIALAVAAWSDRGLAEGNSTFHLGLETSIYSTTSLDGSAPSTAAGGNSTSTKVVSKQSGFGLPGGAALSLGVLFSDHIDLGTRFGYASGSVKAGSESTAAQVDTSTFTIAPYLAWIAGSRGDQARFTAGFTAGLGSGKTKTSIPAMSGTTSEPESLETTLSTTEYGAFLGLRCHASDVVSIDPMLMLMRDTATYKSGSGSDVDLTGTALMLNIGISLWTGGETPATAPGTPTVQPTATPGADGNAPTDGSASPGGAEAPEARSDRITLSFEESRAMTLVRDSNKEVPSVSVVLRDDGTEGGITECEQVTLHAPNQEDIPIEVTRGMATISTRRFVVLKGSLPVEDLRRLVAVPIASNASAPDHWIGVCSERWQLRESERRRLKWYLSAWPRTKTPKPAATPPAAPAPEPETPEPATSEPATPEPAAAPAPATTPSAASKRGASPQRNATPATK